MTVVNPKSISGINSITMASGSDNLLTIHTTNTTERLRVNSDGDVIVGSGITVSPDGDIFATGVTTSTTFSGNFSGGTVSGTTGTFTGDVDIADKIIHTGDTNTAIRFPSADTITFETAGSEALRIDSSGRTLVATTDVGRSGANELTIGSASGDNGLTIRSGDDSEGNIYFSDGSSGGNEESRGIVRFDHANDSFSFFTATGNNFSTEKLRIKSNGIIVAGNSGTSFGNALIQSFIAHGSTAGESAFSAVDTTSVAAGVGGEIAFHGKYNTGAQDYAYLGHIRGIKENATAGNTACALTFHTRPNATAPQERLRIHSGGGISFNGDTATANALDDYEEGTFSFTLANVNAPTYEAQGGTYVKIGRYVFGHGTIGVSSGLDTSDGSGFQPTGLPFTASGEIAVTLGRYTNLLGGKAGSFRNVRNTGTGFILQEGNDSNIAYNECSSSGYLNFTFAYYTTA